MEPVRSDRSSCSCCPDVPHEGTSSCDCTMISCTCPEIHPDRCSSAGIISTTNESRENIPAPSHPEIFATTSTLTFTDRFDHFLARWGVGRMGHRVEPGLYRLGNPAPDSPVLVSANYTLSFDALRSVLTGTDCYILVLDTKGINVWCAAGKGTFGTDELVRMIANTGLASVIRHRTLILPQLGAPGIAAHEVRQRSGFRVEYGPAHVRDLPRYLETRTATPDMRRVRFPLRDRLVLTPIEFVHAVPATFVAVLAFWFLAGPLAALAALTAVLAGTVLFPALLPVIPTHDFSTKGFILGGVIALPFAVTIPSVYSFTLWAALLAALSVVLIMAVVTAYIALNFTGCTPFTSRTGVKKEIFRYISVMVVMAGSGIALAVILGVLRLIGVI